MKMIKNISFIALSVLALGACTSGGFDENPQLDALEEAQAKAPKVMSISVNGTQIDRNSQSIRHVEAKVGDVLNITAIIDGGTGGDLVDMRFEQTFFSTEIEEFNTIYPADATIDAGSDYTFGPVDPGTDGIYNGDINEAIMPLSGASATFEYSYTVPAYTFEDGVYDYTYYAIGDHDQISIHLRPRNSIGYYGIMTLVIDVVE